MGRNPPIVHDTCDKKEKEIKNANIRELLIQHWEHFRHIESERYWFMSVYAAILTGALALVLGDNKSTESGQILLICFLAIFTMIGFLINIRWKQTIIMLSEQIKTLAGNLDGLSDIPGRIKFEADPMRTMKNIRTRNLFPFFYALVLIGLIVIAVLILTQILH
jgi:hypothetical protein